MERPDHIAAHAMGNQKTGIRRFSGVITVIAIHVGLVALMIFGIVAKMEIKKEDLQVAVEEQKIPPKQPPPPPPAFEKPPPPFVPPPDFNIQTEAPPPRAIVTSPAPPPPPPRVAAAPPPPPPPAPTKLESIERTHTKPPYPPISQRMNEQGTTQMIVTIDKTGSVIVAELLKSSGSKRLDDAALDHVKARWKWNPPTQNGQPVETKTQVNVIWSLLDAK